MSAELVVQKASYLLKFRRDPSEQFPCPGQVARRGVMLELFQQRTEFAHTAGGTGAGTTVGQLSNFFPGEALDSSFKLLELSGGLIEEEYN